MENSQQLWVQKETTTTTTTETATATATATAAAATATATTTTETATETETTPTTPEITRETRGTRNQTMGVPSVESTLRRKSVSNWNGTKINGKKIGRAFSIDRSRGHKT
jgi:hypothetical protein